MNRLTFSIASVLVLAGCDPHYVARVDDGAGLAEGSPVVVSSVRVGEVESVRVVDDHVDVELTIDHEHDITMRTDACALAHRTEQGAELIIVPGRGAALEDGHTIPQCELASGDVGDLLRSIGQGMGDLLRQFGQGMLGSGGSNGSGGSGSTQPALPIPFPFGTQPQSGGSSAPSGGAQNAPLPPPPVPPPSGP